MPDLLTNLQDHDLGHLHIIADLWRVELKAPDLRQGRKNLAALLLDEALAAEVVESLPPETKQALADLHENQGRLPWPQFTRRYGEVREIGPGKRDREKPHLDPASTTERLYYYSLIARSFFDTPEGPQEFAYIPDDLSALLHRPKSPVFGPLSRPASPEERADPQTVTDRILDHACTLLAALRLEMPPEEIEPHAESWPYSPAVLQSLLRAAGLLDGAQPDTEETRAFLEAERGPALLRLFQAWRDSPQHNDLRLIPHLQAEGEWLNDPLAARKMALDLLAQLEPGRWWSLPAFIASVKRRQPDFQRPAGDYDSWYIKDTRTDTYLRGFGHWEQVDGALLNYLITGPLHWLGVLDLARPAEGQPVIAFRTSAWAQALLEGRPPILPIEDQPLTADSKLLVHVPRLAPRAARYQIARFCRWEGEKKHAYRYRITPQTLERAVDQGLQTSHLLALLRRHSEAKLPPNLGQALERWAQHGTQARFEQMLVLRVTHPDILNKLKDSRAARFLGDPLGPTTVTVKPGAWQNVMEALGEIGVLSEKHDGKS